LLLVSTGNFKNTDLEAIFVAQIPAFVRAFFSADYVELTRIALIERM